MKITLRKKPVAAIACMLLSLSAAAAWAQSYPSKPVRLLIGFSAGGGADVVARGLAPRLTEQLGQ